MVSGGDCRACVAAGRMTQKVARAGPQGHRKGEGGGGGQTMVPEDFPVIVFIHLLPCPLLHDPQGYAVAHRRPEPDAPAAARLAGRHGPSNDCGGDGE